MSNFKVREWLMASLLSTVAALHVNTYAQVINHGCDISLIGNVAVQVHDDYISASGGIINNDGQLYFQGSLTNESIAPSINPHGSGKVILHGATDQFLEGQGFTFGNLEIDKSEGVLILNSNISVASTLLFTRGNVFLNTNNLLLGSTGKISGESEESYIHGEEGYIIASGLFINSPDPNENQRGLGIFLGTPGDLGETAIIRRNKTIPGVSSGSILRQYEITPEHNNVAFSTQLKISYLSHEVAGFDENQLSIWRDENKDGQWTLENSTPNENTNLVTATSVLNLGNSVITLASSACPDAPDIQLGSDQQIVCTGSTLLLDTQLKDPKFSYTWFRNETDMETDAPSLTITTPGTYRVVVTQSNGCNSTAQVEVIEKPTPTVSFEPDEACFGNASTFTNTSTIAEGTLSFTWNFGDDSTTEDASEETDPEYVYPASGTYEVQLTATSEENCRNTIMQEVTVLSLPEVQFMTAGNCQEQEVLFTADATIPEDQGEAQYEWDFGSGEIANGEDVEFIFEEPGVHEVTLSVTTEKTCTASYISDITINPVSSPSFTAVPQCEPNEILITSTTDQPENIETQTFYFHDGTSTTSDAFLRTYHAEGDYEITLVTLMKNGCETSVTNTVSVEMRDPFISEEVTTCGNEYMFSIDPASLPAGSTWVWKDQTTHNDYTATTSGFHWIEVHYPNGCIYRDSVNLQLNTLLELELEPNITACGTAMLEAGTFEGVSYLWSDGSTTSSIIVTKSGSYSVKVTDQNNCISEVSTEVVILPEPIFDLGEDVILCYGDEFELAPGIEEVSYLWSDGSTSETITITEAGVYRLTLTNELECSTYDEINVSILEPYTVSLGEDTAFCTGSLLTLATDAPAQEYQWGSEETLISTQSTLEVSKAGEYWVHVKNEFGCTTSDTVSVSEKPKPEARFLASSEIEIGDTLQFVQLSFPDQANYAWDFGDGNTSSEEDPSHIYFDLGEYEVKLTVDNEACTDEISKKINVVPVGESPFMFEEYTYAFIESINIYPNPFETQVTVEITLNIESEAAIYITNMNGIIIKERSFTTQTWSDTLDFSNESNDVYLMTILVGNESRVFRLLKQ